MNQRSYSQILDRIARDGLAANTDLAPRILSRIQKGKPATMQPRMKIFVTVLLIVSVIVIGLVSVPSVRAAIQRWIGYVPEVGLVSEAQIRVLAEPVSITREGITLTVEDVWVASDRTLIQYSVEGWPWSSLAAAAPQDGCLDHAILRLPDGELAITQPQSSFGSDTGYQLKSLYPAIPSTINDMTFVLPCLILAVPGEAPENWELPIHLVPAPADTVFPVIEISTPMDVPPPAAPVPTSVGLAADAISLVLHRAVQMDDGYLIYVTLHYQNADLSWIDVPDPAMLHVLDASGQEIPYELDWEATSEIQATSAPGQTTFVIKTTPLQSGAALTLLLDAVSASVATYASFLFDPGPDPKPGQVWELNQTIDLGAGLSVKVARVTYDLTDGTQAWLSFDMESETGVTYASLLDKAHPLTGMAGGGGSSMPEPFMSDLYYLEPLPAGPITVSITGVSVTLPGPWQATWTPPQAP